MTSETDEKTIVTTTDLNLLIANIIPTSKYFEARFDNMQDQIAGLKDGQKELRHDMDNRFEQVDKRFEQIDNRFQQMDNRFEQVNDKLDKIMERVDIKIDAGLREGRSLTVKLFSFAMVFSAISMAGLLGKFSGLF